MPPRVAAAGRRSCCFFGDPGWQAPMPHRRDLLGWRLHPERHATGHRGVALPVGPRHGPQHGRQEHADATNCSAGHPRATGEQQLIRFQNELLIGTEGSRFKSGLVLLILSSATCDHFIKSFIAFSSEDIGSRIVLKMTNPVLNSHRSSCQLSIAANMGFEMVQISHISMAHGF